MSTSPIAGRISPIDDEPIIPEYILRDPCNYSTDRLLTMAMICIIEDYDILDEYKHDPTLKNNDGHTVAMVAIIYKKTIPMWAYTNPEIQADDGDTAAMLYIRTYNCEPPELLRHDPNIRNFINENLAILFIKHCEGDIPGWMLPDQTYGKSLIEYWIQYRVTEDIPEYLISEHMHLMRTNCGDTLAMTWVTHRSTLPPKTLYHEPSLQNRDGSTVAMLLIEQGVYDIEEWRHDLSIKNRLGNTLPMVWMYNNSTICIPEWMYTPELDTTNRFGETILHVWARKCCPWECSDELLKYCQNCVYKYDFEGLTPAMVIATHRPEYRIPIYLRHDPSMRSYSGRLVDDMLLVEDPYWSQTQENEDVRIM